MDKIKIMLFLSAVCFCGSLSAKTFYCVRNGVMENILIVGEKVESKEGFLEASCQQVNKGAILALISKIKPSGKEFFIQMDLAVEDIAQSGLSFCLGGSHFIFNSDKADIVFNNPVLGIEQNIGKSSDYIENGVFFTFTVNKQAEYLHFSINNSEVLKTKFRSDNPVPVAVKPGKSVVRLKNLLITANQYAKHIEPKKSSEITIPIVDLSADFDRHSVVAAGTEDIYQGHPTTVLMPDGKTIYCVWTYNHGGPCGPLKKSIDGGKTWGELLDVPKSWSTAGNCPTIYRLKDKAGKERLFVFACRNDGGYKTMCQSYSEDNGITWTDMADNGLRARVMPFCSIVDAGKGKYLGFSNVRRQGDPDRYSNCVAMSVSEDGGLSWSQWDIILDMPGYKPCEPWVMKSPDGKQLLCIMRENTRELNSLMMLSGDYGKSWSEPKELPASLTGDRHAAKYAPDGRIVFVFRDRADMSDKLHHFVAWVGTYDDIINAQEGQYRIKLMHNYKKGDCGYPGLEVLEDGTFVATTYLKYKPGKKLNSVVSTRFHLSEIDKLAQKK